MEIPKSTMLLFRSFMYTFGEYSWMTRLDSREECHTVLDPIDSEAEIRDLKLRLILLRKYTSPEKRGEDIYALKIVNAIKDCFSDLKEDTDDIIAEIEQIENNVMSSSLSNGENLSLRDTIELELYGIHLHSDIEKIERLTISDPQLRYIAIREYVESYESVLKRTYCLLNDAGVCSLPSKNEGRLYTASCEAPTEEEREVAKAEYLQMVGKCRANSVLNMYD